MIHPNPNNGKFVLKLNYVSIKTTVEIYNKNNERLFNDKVISIEQTIEQSLPKGEYTLKVLEDNRVVSSQELKII